jgi:hypothetical protein
LQHISIQPQTQASIQLGLQELKKQSTTVINILETRFAEVSETLQRLDKKIDQKLTTAITTQQGEKE